jgi:hypothetical protein
MRNVVVKTLYQDFNPASETDYVYGRFADTYQVVPGGVKTAGSSTTISENATGDASFAAVGVGDLLYNRATGDTVLVTAKASDASITSGTAVNWAANSNVQVRKFQSGQTSADGWIGVGHLSEKVLHIEVEAIASASVTFSIEIKQPGMAPTTILTPAAFTAASVSSTTGVSSFADIAIPETAHSLRLGVKVGTDGTDIVSASLMGVRND